MDAAADKFDFSCRRTAAADDDRTVRPELYEVATAVEQSDDLSVAGGKSLSVMSALPSLGNCGLEDSMRSPSPFCEVELTIQVRFLFAASAREPGIPAATMAASNATGSQRIAAVLLDLNCISADQRDVADRLCFSCEAARIWLRGSIGIACSGIHEPSGQNG